MKKIPTILQNRFLKELHGENITATQNGDHLKWLRFYLNFCEKYRFPPRSADSLPLFLNKLTEKNQSQAQQAEACEAVKLFYRVVEKYNDWGNDSGDAYSVVLEQLENEIKFRQYSPKTLQTYRLWVADFLKSTQKPAEDISDEDAKNYLTFLAVKRKVASSTQNQAFNALLFLFRHILKREYDLKDRVVRAKRTKYIPVVLSRNEVQEVISKMREPYKLPLQILYGCGLRLFECMNLRVHNLNFDDGIVTVHDGKGKKDRTVPLPESLFDALQKHLGNLEILYNKDSKNGFSGVFMPTAMTKKWNSASKEFPWQWLFPAKLLTLVPETGEYRRYHMHESKFQKALRAAVKSSKITKRVTAHTFRHSFASHLLQANYDIRTIQEMLGHSDVRTTMIYTHTVKSRTLKERKSPLDFDAAHA